MKVCSKCKQQKPLSGFYLAAQCVDGVRPDCKECNKSYRTEYARQKAKTDPKPRRNTLLKSKYGISIEDFETLKSEQNSQCKICGSSNPGPKGVFAVDHCHKSGKVRGLLCYLCNLGLGSFKDSAENLSRAIVYLKENGH